MSVKQAENYLAEVMSVGDEIVTGHRLDTNSQWICQALGNLGIAVRFLSAVGDNLTDHVQSIQQSLERVDLIVMTGGLGPTADDLTREAIAQAIGVGLEFSQAELSKIKRIFERAGRQMPPRNEAQAWFPVGSMPVPNPEGTAPGIDILVPRKDRNPTRIIALPGVPAEMKQMWTATVEPRLREWTQSRLVFRHHTLHCFGAGESTIEEMLPNLIERGRDPSVGITASQATISLRVATRASSETECLRKMEPTIQLIRSTLGDLVFGENAQTLPEVVAEQLACLNLRCAIWDFGFNGQIMSELDRFHPDLCAQRIGDPTEFNFDEMNLADLAIQIQQETEMPIGMVIGPIDRDEHRVTNGQSIFRLGISSPLNTESHELKFWGHSAWREQRAVKQIFNQIRLHLQKMTVQKS